MFTILKKLILAIFLFSILTSCRTIPEKMPPVPEQAEGKVWEAVYLPMESNCYWVDKEPFHFEGEYFERREYCDGDLKLKWPSELSVRSVRGLVVGAFSPVRPSRKAVLERWNMVRKK